MCFDGRDFSPRSHAHRRHEDHRVDGRANRRRRHFPSRSGPTGFRMGRLKTGTPPRILRCSVDLSRFAPQPGDDPPDPSRTGRTRSVSRRSSVISRTRTRRHTRSSDGRARSIAALPGRYRGHRYAVLSLDRGQGRSLSRQDAAPDLYRTRRPASPRALPERHLDEHAGGCSARDASFDPGSRDGGHAPAGVRGGVRLLPSRSAQTDAREQAHRGALLCRAGQRDLGLRRGCGTGVCGGDQRRPPLSRR